MQGEHRGGDGEVAGQPDGRSGAAAGVYRVRAADLAEALSDAVAALRPDWPQVAAWARELAKLAEGAVQEAG